jgi:hypothetical protein
VEPEIQPRSYFICQVNCPLLYPDGKPTYTVSRAFALTARFAVSQKSVEEKEIYR